MNVVDAREQLMERVQAFNDGEAQFWLARIEGRPPDRPFSEWTELQNWSKEKLDELFKKHPPEVDMESFVEWEDGTASDAKSLDEF
jgi:hypothetical protein